MNVTTSCARDTELLGEKIASVLQGKEMIALFGDLGAGKTALTRGLCTGLGIKDGVCSPTFAIVNAYQGKFPVYHFDMYRIDSEDDVESTGFYDYPFEDNVAAVEWSENIAEFLPKDTIYVTINSLGENDREIIIEDGGRFAAAWD